MTAKKNWDVAAFSESLMRCVDARGLQLKDVSKATGVSQSTLSRMKNQGRHPDAASLAALSAWSGLSPAQFMFDASTPSTVRFCADALASAIREMVKADIQGDGERYSVHETAMRRQLHALERALSRGVQFAAKPTEEH